MVCLSANFTFSLCKHLFLKRGCDPLSRRPKKPRWMNCRLVVASHSQFLNSRLLLSSQVKLCLAIQRLGTLTRDRHWQTIRSTAQNTSYASTLAGLMRRCTPRSSSSICVNFFFG